MATSRRGSVTELEYGRPSLVPVGARAGVPAPAPDAEADLASAIREAHASGVVAGRAPTRSAVRGAAGGRRDRTIGAGHDGIDKAKATAAGLLCTNTPASSISRWPNTRCCSSPPRARTLNAMSRAWRDTCGIRQWASSCKERPRDHRCGGIGRSVARIASLGMACRSRLSRPDAPPPTVLEHFVRSRMISRPPCARGFRQPHISGSRNNHHWLNRERLASLGERSC